MATVAVRDPIRCFCSVVARHTDDNIFVCGRCQPGGMVCLFHLHEENLENYYQSNGISMPLDCELCLATLKIHSKEYIAPCRITSVRCHCGDVASFTQSKQNNANNSKYFFGCPKWRTLQKCNYFSWCHEYRTVRNIQVLRGLIVPLMTAENQIEQSRKRTLHQDDDDEENEKYKELKRRFECVLCLSDERCYLISPCNHLCCCEKCSIQIQNECPICRGHVRSIQRIFCV